MSTLEPPGLLTTSEGFTGHEEDDELGLVHMKGRTYDPKLGRFLQADPFVQAPAFSQSWNRYAYVWNNPLTLIDPSGYANDSNCAKRPVGSSGCSSTTNPPAPPVFVPSSWGVDPGTGGAEGSAGFEPPPVRVYEDSRLRQHSWRDETWMWSRGEGAAEAGRERSEGLNGGGGQVGAHGRGTVTGSASPRVVERGGEHGGPGWSVNDDTSLPTIGDSVEMILTAAAVMEAVLVVGPLIGEGVATEAAAGAEVGAAEAVGAGRATSSGLKLRTNIKGGAATRSTVGGGRNAQHANAARRAVAKERYEILKTELEKLRSAPNKTKEMKDQLERLERAVKKAKREMDFTGENHSQRGKG